MPILVADRNKRIVAAIHCGRKGLEKKIIRDLIKIFNKLGSSKNDLLIAIGPSISKKNYLVDKKTYLKFLKDADIKELTKFKKETETHFPLKELIPSDKKDLMQLDLKKYAYKQLLNENIPSKNIEISKLCTFEYEDEFYSWRKTKTNLRQWNFICA